jgi:RNA polymerase sigma factor (sigma-70 family)
MNTIIQHLRRAALAQDGAGMTDGQLLEAFIARKDDETFDALLHRHGAMVMDVCFRILRNHHDSEDAFQATFLVLARKASSVRPRQQVANWLHGVAYRTALKARAMRAKTQVRERQVAQMPEPEGVQQDNWTDLQPVLDEELSRLPNNYRLPLLLCDLEGKSIKEATQQLGWPQGTLAGRLARARKMLAKRLTQRGVVLSGGALAVVLTEKAMTACVPLSLAASTTKAAVTIAAGQAVAPSLVSAKVAALMEGVMKGMMLTKLKTLTVALLMVGIVAFGGGTALRHSAAAQQVKVEQEGKKPAIPRTENPPKSLDERKLHGEWICKDDKDVNLSIFFGPNNSFRIIIENGRDEVGTYSVDWRKTPYHLDLKKENLPEDQTIMEFLAPGKLRIEDGAEVGVRPKAFTDEAFVLTKKETPRAGSKEANEQAEKDLGIAEFYRRTSKFGSAHFYYELVGRRYPDTDFAKKAKQGLEDLKKHRIRRADGSEAWEELDQPRQPQSPPKVMDITPPQAERLLEQAMGDKNEVARMSIKMLSPSMFVATSNLVIEKDGRARLEPFRAIIFGTDKNSQVTVVISERAIVTFDKPIGELADLVGRTIVGTEFTGKTEMRTVNINRQDGGDKAKANENPKGDTKEKATSKVGEIIVIGSTMDSAIRKAMQLYPGQVLDDKALRAAEKNLAAFDATIEVVDTNDTRFKDILVRVKKK